MKLGRVAAWLQCFKKNNLMPQIFDAASAFVMMVVFLYAIGKIWWVILFLQTLEWSMLALFCSAEDLPRNDPIERDKFGDNLVTSYFLVTSFFDNMLYVFIFKWCCLRQKFCCSCMKAKTPVNRPKISLLNVNRKLLYLGSNAAT